MVLYTSVSISSEHNEVASAFDRTQKKQEIYGSVPQYLKMTWLSRCKRDDNLPLVMPGAGRREGVS